MPPCGCRFWCVGAALGPCGRQELHVHLCYPWVPEGANLTTSCFWKTVKSTIERGKVPLNQTLFLQVGGASDNVNKTTLTFASWLCQKKVCKTVRRRRNVRQAQLPR